METIDTTADGSCGFWCLLAFLGSCLHAVVRSRQEQREKKKQDIQRDAEAAQAMARGKRSLRGFAPAENLIGLVDYELLGQMVWHMNSDKATWERVERHLVGPGYAEDLDDAMKVIPATRVHPNVGANNWMTQLHLGYFAVKLGMPVFCALERSQGERIYIYAVWRASGEPTFFETESQMEAEMHKEPPPVAPLFLPPPLFLLEDNHWSLHQPRGEHLSSRSAKQARFQELFPQSP